MIAPWRVFPVEVSRLQRLSPSFLRVTFTGDELSTFADNGFDQRIKMILPLEGSGMANLPTGPDWQLRWRELPSEQRNPIRTYTVRAVRPSVSEVDIDMVLHPGGCGPAANWLAQTGIGDKLALLGPDARYSGPHGGIDFRPPAQAETLLLAGDETAVPAIMSIVERLPAGQPAIVLLEVPHRADALPIDTGPQIDLTWLPRYGAAPGATLIPAVKGAVASFLPAQAGQPIQDVDVDNEILWEVPDTSAKAGKVYAWLAAEAWVIKTLRRHLLAECGLDRQSVAFMGYWRLGRSESL